jgi:hypothetical protein
MPGSWPNVRGSLFLLGLLMLADAASAQPPATLREPSPEVAPPTSPILLPIPTTDKLAQLAGPAYAPGSAGSYGVSSHDELAPFATPATLPFESDIYGAVELGILKPHVSARVSANALLPESVRVPVAPLDWIPSPRIELGYRLPEAAGDLRVAYELLADSGTNTSGFGNLHSRLDFNSIDLDYVSSEWLADATPDLLRTLRATFGVRLASGYLSTAADLPVSSRLTSQFYGAGPRFGIEWRKPVDASFEVYVRTEATGLLGKTQQTASAGFAGGETPWQSNGVAIASAQVGFTWRPMESDGFCVVAGYKVEQWWNIGRTDYGNADVTVQGIFLRAEWRY